RDATWPIESGPPCPRRPWSDDVNDDTARVWRFPYPPMHVFVLVTIVLLIFGHSFYTLHTVRSLAGGQPVSRETMRLVLGMFALTAGLAIFVTGALLVRGRLTLGIHGNCVEV